MAKLGLRKYSSLGLGNCRSKVKDIRSCYEKRFDIGISCQSEFEKVHNLNLNLNLNLNINKFTNVDAGFNLFDGVIHTRPLPSVHIFNHLLDAVTNLKHYSYTIHLFKQMCDIGVPVDEYSMSIAVKCYCHLNNTHHGFTVLGFFLKRGILPIVEIYNTLLDGFILEDKTHEAERLFKNIIFQSEDVNVVTYNTMIKGLCKVGNYFTAIGLMRLMDVNPDLVTYNTIIHGLCNDLFIDDAFMLFKQIKAIHPNVVTYNSLIYALCNLDRWDDVSSFLKQMQDVPTFTILLDAFAKKGYMKEAELVFDLLSRSGYYPDIMTYNSLIHGYCVRGEMNKAKSIFDTMGVNPNIHTYNSLLNGYVKVRKIHEAARLYKKLIYKERKLKPDMTTHFIMIQVWDSSAFSTNEHKVGIYETRLLHVCETFEIDEAFSLFQFGDVSNFRTSSKHYRYVIDAALKRGKIDIARRLFHEIFVKRLPTLCFTYGCMVRGLCEARLLKEALQTVFKMEKRDRWKASDDMVCDLIDGYTKYKHVHDVSTFLDLIVPWVVRLKKEYESLLMFRD